jgi:diguanylate cyclase (GGDEF)-like protein
VAARSWLVPDDPGRVRMLDMDAQLHPYRTVVFAILAAALIACGPWTGWWTLAPLAVAASAFVAVDRIVPHVARPEYALFAAWLTSELVIGASVAVAGGAIVPMIAWLAIPVLTLGARFSHRGMWIGTGFAVGVAVAVAVIANPHAVAANPPLLIAPVALILCVALFQIPLTDADLQLRSEIVVDPLTGMLNRKALGRRVEELEQQAPLTQQPLALILGDIDHFKGVNDNHGHVTGDAVLAAVAARLRGSLRAFDLCYRIGGEEFLVIVLGATLERAVELAEQLRLRIAADAPDAIGVTMSFGVAAVAGEDRFDFGSLFAAADTALYRAKRAGRNCVRTATATAPVRGGGPGHLARAERPSPNAVLES